MKIDIRHIAKLSRLRVEDEEVKKFEREMEKIVSMVENLPQLDDTGALIDQNNPMVFRPDIVENHFKRDELLKNAPQTRAGCVVVPKVVE